MDLDREDATSLQAGSTDVASQAAGAVTVADSNLTVPDENKNGGSNSSSESGLEVDRASVGHGSAGSDGEREIEPTEMVSSDILRISAYLLINGQAINKSSCTFLTLHFA